MTFTEVGTYYLLHTPSPNRFTLSISVFKQRPSPSPRRAGLYVTLFLSRTHEGEGARRHKQHSVASHSNLLLYRGQLHDYALKGEKKKSRARTWG
jgi:hypothetical protein